MAAESEESDSVANSPLSEAAGGGGGDASQDPDGCEPRLALPQQKQRGKKRQWVSDTFQSLLESVGAGSESGAEEAAVAKAVQGSDRETALELERLLGEVSSYEGRLDNLLDFSSSIPDRNGVDGEDRIL